jgi:Zn-dependent protease with chaperone function
LLVGQPTFIARATHPSFGGEAAEGRITIDGTAFRFESGDGGTLEIPLIRLRIEAGESEAICFGDPEQPDWSIYTFDQRILQHHSLLQNSMTRMQLRAMREETDNKWRLKATICTLAAITVLCILAPICMGLLVKIVVARVPASVELQMGATALAEVKQEVKFLNDSNLMAKLDMAVAPLLAVLPPAPNKYTFYIADDEDANAFALPGGAVVVNKGLLDIADRPEQIAGVLAHEIAHVTQKHALRQSVSSFGPALLLELFASSDNRLIGALGGMSQLMVIQSFSQEFEFEADSVGWDYLVAARIDPRGMIEMFKKFKAEEDREKAAFGADIPALSSHPTTRKRIERLEAKWRKLRNKSGFIEFEPWPAGPKSKV